MTSTPRTSAEVLRAATDEADDIPRLNWRWTEHWSGEWGEVDICGLYAKVRDCDGDFTWWVVRKGQGGATLAEGERSDANHFFGSVRDAEDALRRIIGERIAALKAEREARAIELAEAQTSDPVLAERESGL